MDVTSEQLLAWITLLERLPGMHIDGSDIAELCSGVAAYLRANIPVPLNPEHGLHLPSGEK